MWNAIIALGVTVTIFAITFVVGGYAMTHVWSVSDQVVQNSGNSQLQESYQTGKQIIDQAGNLQDSSDLTQSLENRGK